MKKRTGGGTAVGMGHATALVIAIVLLSVESVHALHHGVGFHRGAGRGRPVARIAWLCHQEALARLRIKPEIGQLRGGSDGETSQSDSAPDDDVSDLQGSDLPETAGAIDEGGSSGGEEANEYSGVQVGAGVGGSEGVGANGAVYQAAFGIPVASERQAALVNAVLTALCTATVALIRAFYRCRGTAAPNPMVMELTMNAFLVCTTLQTGLAVSMYGQGLLPMLKGFLQDLTGGGNPPKSKEEALARRRRQMMALKAMRTVSTVVAMFVMRRRSRPATGDSEAAEEGSVSSATLLDSVREGMTGLYAKGEALWGDFLELVFKAAGDEIALAGLRVSRGHVLSEDEKAHVRALVEEEERVAALEAEGQDGGAGEASVYGGATPGVQSREVRLGLRTATEEEVAAADKGSESRSFGDVVASFLPTGSGGGAGGGMMGALATMFAGRKNAQIAPALEQGEAGGEVASAGSQPEARQSGEQEGVGQGKGGGETRSETMVLRQPEGQGSAPASTCDVAQEEVSDASGVALQEEDKKLELRAGRLDEELSVGEEQEERGEDGETDGETAQKATPSIIDMIPSAYQPVAFGGACAGFMCMLASKLFAMDAALACTSIGKLPKKTALQSQGPLREKQLADLVVAAFDDAKVPRDRFLPRLSAVLAAVGSAQGFLRVFFTEDSKPVRAPDSSDGGSSGSRAWITSPMAKYVSTFNGHMIWFIVSTLLSGLGSYNKKGVYFVATPDRKSAYSESGLQGGVVTGGMHGAKHYQVTLALDFADGKMIKHSKTYDLDDFTDVAHAEAMGPAPPKVVNFASLDFVKAVQKDMIQDMPAPADPNSFAA